MVSHSLLQTGAAGVQAGLQQAKQAASDIAAAVNHNEVFDKSGALSDNEHSLVHSVVDLLQAENQVKASAQVVKTADQLEDQLIGTMIDTLV